VDRVPRGEWTESAFDDEAAEQFRLSVHASVLTELEGEMTKAAGASASGPVDLHADAQLSEFNGRRIILVFFSASALTRGVSAAGIVGDSLVAVTCVREGVRSVPLDEGSCFERLQEAYPAE
jgi:hypothetical protein